MMVARILALAAGYFPGMFQTGYIYGKLHGIDIRTQGSGNAGTTNTLCVLGWKAGAVTFIGDLCKAILAVVIIHLLYRERYPDAVGVLELYAGFGAVLGHNFPFYLKFQGGKGIACTSGMILAVCPMAAPFCLLLFIGAVVSRIHSGGDRVSRSGDCLRATGISVRGGGVPAGILCCQRMLYSDGALEAQG